MRTLALTLLIPLVASANFCINAGGPITYVNNDGVSVQCFADNYFVGGTAYSDPTMGADELSTLRFGSFTYSLPTVVGIVAVDLDFVEPGNITGPGQRLFNVFINGQPARAYTLTVQGTGNLYLPGSEDFDLWSLVGLKGHYTVKYFVVSYGTVKIEFRTKLRNAVVSKITIEEPETTGLPLN